MSVELTDSETLKNLMRAFAGESQARSRYTFAAWKRCFSSPPDRRRSTRKSSTAT